MEYEQSGIVHISTTNVNLSTLYICANVSNQQVACASEYDNSVEIYDMHNASPAFRGLGPKDNDASSIRTIVFSSKNPRRYVD